MTLHLTSTEVAGLVDMADALAAVEECMRALGRDGTVNMPRQRLPLPGSSLQVMAAAMPGHGLFGLRSYASARQGGGGKFNRLELYGLADRRLVAIMDCEPISHLRTGAATAVAAKYLAPPAAGSVGMIGTGRQARLQLIALAASRKLTHIEVWSRDAERRQRFAGEMARVLGLPVSVARDARACVAGAELVVAATKSSTPVIERAWLRPGAHVTGMGANAANRREIDDETVLAADVVCVDDVAQARLEAGELISLVAAGRMGWDRVASLADIVQSHAPGRQRADQLTLFKSLGVAIEDVALAAVVYARAVERGVGRQIEL